ncbi:MAG: alpha/beta hydrolase [Thiofilum sp.]|uniref:RBBP9/YdeN family alpha/beta hydrolase n=1 Tax=Thiofilum sp. TaxID=2212733 RepID=UPI0025E4A3EB|nr:alpha/beta hydrolase [Thiofilum sp.]MBK8454158.1 alpha/beta hydrolase [Thiofilum sp.]
MEHILIVPGLYGSELQHWQTWIERKLPNTIRVEQDNWDNPVLIEWSRRIVEYIDQHRGKIWLIAHSFGCLASVHAAFQRPERITGAMLVAPAEPNRFNVQGFVMGKPYINSAHTIASQLPKQPLPFPSAIVASTNDPWMSVESAQAWADAWESLLINIGDAGHINVASGFGAWPKGLEIFNDLYQSQAYLPQGSFSLASSF